ncbi:MAG: 4-hydroxy-3-methylbut-2-enyl diphosphate reductase [Kiritimatiellia bacterium]
MTVHVLNPHGFCAGVTGAIHKALALLAAAPRPIYCLHELVHNEIVVSGLKARGMVFVESLEEIPDGATVLFSAHGVSPAVRADAAARHLRIVDATCPFVTRVHRAAAAYAAHGLQVVILGHPNHAEVKGIMGEAPGSLVIEPNAPTPRLLDIPASRRPDAPPSLGVVSQTTLNADDVRNMVARLKQDFTVATMAEVCHATKERQDAVKAFAGDALLVLGSPNSSNTKRLCEVARCRTFRAGTLDEVKALDFTGVETLGVTSGASTPEDFFARVVTYLKQEEGR